MIKLWVHEFKFYPAQGYFREFRIRILSYKYINFEICHKLTEACSDSFLDKLKLQNKTLN